MFLKVLDKLIAEKKINKSVLAKESGIPYTTIDGFYKKGWENVKLSTLLKLAAYFEVSVDYLVSGEGKRVATPKKDVAVESYTEKEKKVISVYREGGEKLGGFIVHKYPKKLFLHMLHFLTNSM